ncbi:fimbrial protein (plasmid) [Klebsiella aerogenes]
MCYKTCLSTNLKMLAFLFAGVALLFASYSWAYDGTINVTGNIIDGSCDIDSDTINVNLGNVPVSTFKKVHDRSNVVPFNITLSNCPASITGADIMFIGEPDDKNYTLLKLTQGAGVAENVAVEILQVHTVGAYNHILLYLNTRYPTNEDIKEGTSTMTYALRYEATALPVTVGTGNAIMYYNIYYR